LALAPDRFFALLEQITAVQGPHAVFLPQGAIDFVPVTPQDHGVLAGAFPDDLLHGPDSIGIGAFEGQHHGLDRFARALQQQAVQGVGGPLTLFATLKPGAVDGVRVLQGVDQVVNVLRSQLHHRSGFHRFHHGVSPAIRGRPIITW
jgi:hypothetical protein